MTQAAGNYSRVPAQVHGVIAGFLQLSDIVNAGTTCKKWQEGYLVESVWKRAISQSFGPQELTAREFVQFQRQVHAGRCVRTELLRSGPMEESDLHEFSNCFLDREGTKAKVYGMKGEFICTIDLAAQNAHPSLSHAETNVTRLTADELIVIMINGQGSYFLFYSRKTGEFLRSFNLERMFCVDLVGILENPNQLVFEGVPHNAVKRRNPRLSIYAFDFSGKEVFRKHLDGQKVFFCAQTGLLFRCEEGAVYEETLKGVTRKLFDLPKWSNPIQGRREPKTDGIHASDRLVCVYSNYGELYVCDSATGKELLHTNLPLTCKNGEGLYDNLYGIREISFLGGSILIKYLSDLRNQLQIACLDVHKQLIWTVPQQGALTILSAFPFVNSLFILNGTNYGEHCLALRDIQGKMIRAFAVQSMADCHDDKKSWKRAIRCAPTGQVVIPCKDRLIFLDFHKLVAPQPKDDHKGA